MDAAEWAIIALNAVLGLACGWRSTAFLGRISGGRVRRIHAFPVLLAAYVVECAAFSASMGTNALGFGLALLWGAVLGVCVRRLAASEQEQRRAVWWLAVYSSLPAASYASVPVLCAIGGWSVLNPQAGARFGIPGFLPWPLNTILGFCVLVAAVGVLVKVTLTTRLAFVLIRRGSRHAPAGA